MKSLFVAAALFAGSAALAQQTVAPSNSAPERDARGIPVVSDPATAPAGTNQAPPPGTGPVVPNPNQAAAFATQPASGEAPPPCSRTVTDNCIQAYEVGRRRGPR